MSGYRGFASKEAYETHYSDPSKYTAEICSMEAYTRESMVEEKLLCVNDDDMVERVARALFLRDVEEDVCDGTWEENEALHPRILADARAAIAAMGLPHS